MTREHLGRLSVETDPGKDPEEKAGNLAVAERDVAGDLFFTVVAPAKKGRGRGGQGLESDYAERQHGARLAA